jgi:hypothetical protein
MKSLTKKILIGAIVIASTIPAYNVYTSLGKEIIEPVHETTETNYNYSTVEANESPLKSELESIRDLSSEEIKAKLKEFELLN